MIAHVAGTVAEKPVIYQLVVRLFGNTNETRKPDGTLVENGVGRFADVDERAISAIKGLGATHVWLTGVLRQATMTDWSEIGLPASDPDTVKGRAGSFFAIRDYYDVCPDYAVDPRRRMEEFEALVARLHAGGLRVLIDLVPNHVARGYGSVVHPERDFGRGDDKTRFFAPDNAFFYLVDPPGQALRLARPAGWNPSGVVFDGAFEPEDGRPGNVPRATGNDVTSPSPSPTDWYETVKLSYGVDFTDRTVKRFDPVPATWSRMDEILAYWQAKGVDGFRVDFAHWVPNEAWRYLLSRAKARDPAVLLVAEAYEDLAGLLAAGFDAVYHDAALDTLKRVILGAASLDDLDAELRSLDDGARGRFVQYLENHDERRVASPVVPGHDPEATGLGSADAGRWLAPILLLYGSGPVLFHNGQEVGEPAALAEGFSGADGRTSIFDYGSMPAFARWVNGHRYDGGRSTPDELALRAWYADLLALCQAPEVRGTRYWGLRYATDSTGLFPFARFATGQAALLLVVASFDADASGASLVCIPDDLAEAAGLPEQLDVSLVLDSSGASSRLVAATTRASLSSRGLVVTVPARTTNVYRIHAPGSPRGSS
jgi:glycosidase